MPRNLRRATAAKIRKARRAQGRSQQWLAAQIGVARFTVSRWETHGIWPHHPAVAKIEAALTEPGRARA